MSAPYRAAGSSYRDAWPARSITAVITTFGGSCGHFASKSRHYSTTLGAIRGERRAYRQQQTAEHARELLEGDTTLVVSHWEFTGLGYLTTGDTTLALSAAARAREQRQAARDAA